MGALRRVVRGRVGCMRDAPCRANARASHATRRISAAQAGVQKKGGVMIQVREERTGGEVRREALGKTEAAGGGRKAEGAKKIVRGAAVEGIVHRQT